MNHLSIIIPCYNEEAVLRLTYEKLSEVLKKSNRPYEIIFVDDGSKDKTWNIAKELAENDNKIAGISFASNRGKEAAMMAGLVKSKGDLIAIMDADLQDPPELLESMIQLIEEEHYDQVGTMRKSRSSQSPIRAWLSTSYYHVFNKISDTKVKINEREYRMMTRQVVNEILRYGEVNRYLKGIWSNVGFKIGYIEYDDIPRAAGETKYNIVKLFSTAFHNITSYTANILKYPIYLGILEMVVLICFIVVKLLTNGFDSTDSLFALFLFNFSFIFLCIGIVGSYLNKIYHETKQRPLYSIQDQIDSKIF